MPAAAQGDGRAAAQPEDLAFLVDDLKIPFHTKRSVANDGYFGAGHKFLRLRDCEARSSITITRDARKDKKVGRAPLQCSARPTENQGKVCTPNGEG